MDIYVGDNNHNCFTNSRFVYDVFLFASTKEQLQKSRCDFKHSTEIVGLKKYIQEKRKFLETKARTEGKKAKLTIKVEIFSKEESTKHLVQTITFQQQDTTEIKNRIRASWTTFYKHKM